MLRDPGGVRATAARWVITGELRLASAAHLGGGPGDSVDMAVLRDTRTGAPLLTGASLAGALRSHLADVLGGYRSKEDPSVAQLFGGARGDDFGEQSPLIVFDSLGRVPAVAAVEIRDGLQIDTARGTAEPHKKFDLEVLPAGTKFPIRMDVLLSDPDLESQLLSLLTTALSGLAYGNIALGARRSRGLGAVQAGAWRAVRYDLTSRAGWLGWLSSDWDAPVPEDVPALDDVREAWRRAHPGLALSEFADQRRRVLITAVLSASGGLLVRSAPAAPDAPDAVHLESSGRPVLPGTSMAGVFRAHALRIARIAREGSNDPERYVSRLFGPRLEGTARSGSADLHSSRLRIAEAFIEDGTRLRPSRVRIDRFTQAVISGALFDEEPDFGGRVRIRFELRDPKPGELGLLLLALRDLLAGELPVGGTSSAGRGRFHGTAILQLEDGRSIALDPVAAPDPFVDQAIEELWSAAIIGETL
jgi:CRISPR/Cas system CSM-associated protein Csm3 (group 7 of RAMP superfamily)